jgi:hypothetical protein
MSGPEVHDDTISDMAKKKGASKLDAEIGGLYALPLGEFTPARNALAARLKKEGDKEVSERVKGFAKPSVSAWAVNVLFRDERERMDALLAAGERARHALGEALTHGAAETLRGALQDERELRDELRRRAVDLLTEDGRAPGRAIVDRITVNLESLALSPAAAEAAERGWLDADLDPPGFEILAGLQLGAARRDRRGLRLVPQAPRQEKQEKKETKARREEKPAPAPREDAVESKRRQREEAAREREETAERERREREEAKTRERLGRAEEKVARAAEEAESLRAEAERAERAATEAERAAEEARRRAEAAHETAGRARTRAERAAQQLARAEADLEGLR